MDDATRAAVETLAAPELDAATIPAPCACGATLAPDGICLEVGACERADASATRGATGARAKSDPSAWTVRGRVD
jgi:hypothetical protein